jgi:TPP-dependent indolepyruvate ferredoxin oxidoreductase alpha subunit
MVVPWYVTAFLKLVGPFIDPLTKTKIRYNEPLTDHVPASQLMKNAGGECEFEYDHSVYWPALTELAEKRRNEKKERWERAGKHIGESEIYLWGGDQPSVGGMTNGAQVDEVSKAVEGLDVNSSEEPVIVEVCQGPPAGTNDGTEQVKVAA